MVYYLKVNRNCEYSIKNLQHWIDIIEFDNNGTLFIICDNSKLEEIIRERIQCGNSLNFIRSEKSDNIREIIENTCVEKWYNAGYAHLTTFWHAKENGIKKFWNIDADDTLLCLQPQRCYELLKTVEEDAKGKGIDLYSLDMWTTVVERVYNCYHWTFGVTYTNNEIEWLDVIKEHCFDEGIKKLKLVDNIDKYFTYLSDIKDVSIETFFIDRLKFIHYSDDFFSRPEGSGFYFWKKGYLHLPIISNCFGERNRGKLRISKRVNRINMNVSEKEELLFLNSLALDNIIRL